MSKAKKKKYEKIRKDRFTVNWGDMEMLEKGDDSEALLQDGDFDEEGNPRE